METDNTMAHNLATIDGRIAMTYQGMTPWHKLGVRVPSLTNVGDALTAASINFTVRAESLYLAGAEPGALGAFVPTRKAIVRNGDNAILSTVGKDYEIMQHTEGFGALNVLCSDHGMTIESAGALSNGARVWMLFKMPDTITPVPGDDVRGYLLATTGHDGSWSYSIRPTPVRVVCQNTLDAATLNGGVDFVKLFHTKGNADKFAIAADVVARVVKSFTETGDTFAAFARRVMTNDEVITYIETIFAQVDGSKPSKTIDARRRTVAELVWRGVGAELARSSTNGRPNVWGCYNAVTEYFDHVRPGESKSPAGARRANESAIFGAGADLKLAALKLSRQLVAA